MAKNIAKDRSLQQSPSYRRLDNQQRRDELVSVGKVPKGFVPILVWLEANSTERVLVKVKQFKDPRVVTLLQMAEMEMRCMQQGVLRVTCDADYFRRVVGAR